MILSKIIKIICIKKIKSQINKCINTQKSSSLNFSKYTNKPKNWENRFSENSSNHFAHDKKLSEEISHSFWNYLQRRSQIDCSKNYTFPSKITSKTLRCCKVPREKIVRKKKRDKSTYSKRNSVPKRKNTKTKPVRKIKLLY